MKKFRFFILFAFLAAAMVSCEDFKLGDASLEKPAGNEDNLDSLFSCKVNAEQALVAAYTSLPDMLKTQLAGIDVLESLTDLNNSGIGWGPMRQWYYTGQINSSTPQAQAKYDYINGGWPGIRNSWVFIENVGRVPDMTEQEKAVRIAEAKTIIAIHYLEMFRNFGGIPWIDHSYRPAEEMSSFPRMTVEETVTKIAGLLDEAIPALPWTVSAAEDGRITKLAAMGLKVRLYLFAASPLFNDDAPYMEGEASSAFVTWYGNKDEARWNKAVEAGEQFFNALKANGVYKLYDEAAAPRYSFRNGYFNRHNNEVLISTRKFTKYPAKFSRNTLWDMPNYGIICPTLDYVEMFPMTDGSDFDWNNPEHAAHPFFDADGKPVRDPRLYETAAVPGDEWQGRTCESWLGGRDRKENKREKSLFGSGFTSRKFRQDFSTMKGKFYSYPYLRLSEIYLSMAEALNEVGRTAEAYEYVKVVRDRVQMPNFKPGLSKEEFREQILRERALELGYEGVRLYDLIRWKKEDVFRKKLRGLDTEKVGSTFKYTPFNVPNARAWQDNWSPKWYLTAIPIDEINKKYGTIQNPGW